FQAEDGIRDFHVTGVQTCALPISSTRKATKLSNPSRDAIATSLRRVAAPPQSGMGFESLDGFDNFVAFLVLDALISNRDRHEQKDRKSVVEGKSVDVAGSRSTELK